MNVMRIWSLLNLVLLGTLGPHIAAATLGEPEVSVQADAEQLRASIKSTEDRVGYRVHEVALPSGTLLREFVGPDGKVFAVAWRGPHPPDLRQALGRHFDTYVSAPNPRRFDHKHLQIQQDDLVVQAGGHMLAFSGRAYLISAVPSGVNLGDLH
jgi:Protein of unknown function (DUF2844)